MSKLKNNPLWMYVGIPFTTVAMTAWVRSLLAPLLGPNLPIVLFILPVFVSAWFGAYKAAFMATLLSLGTASYFFMSPFESLYIEDPLDQVRLLVFLIFTCTSTGFIIKIRNREHRLQQEIAYRRQAEESLSNSEAALKEAYEKAEAASRAKSDFLANMSHEIRTPMNAVVGIASILAMSKKIPEEKQQELVKTLQLSAQALMNLINDLLDIAKIESGEVRLENQNIDLEQLADTVMNIMSVRARSKDLSLSLEYDPGLRERFIGDAHRMQQVLMNLVSNAIKFTEHGGITVKIHPCPNTTTGKDDACIEVVDTGVGIPKEQINAIFDKFSQAHPDLTHKYGGTGLGLAITKMLVELMGGHITVESIVGRGSIFRVTFPMVPAVDEMPHDNRDTLRITDNTYKNAGRRRILLIEDYQPNILVATSILSTMGYSYDVARNGKEALDKIEQEAFDLLLMDIRMPVLDGYETTKKIREREKTRGTAYTPIIAVTAHALKYDRQKCLETGMDDYIAKPFDPKELNNKIITLINKHSQPAPESAAKKVKYAHS